jgi:HlyD family secretion protein
MSTKSNFGFVLKLLFWVLLLGAAAAGGAWYLLREQPLDVTVMQVTKGRVEETVAALSSGAVVAGQSARVAAAGMGTIGKVHVIAGQKVLAGDLLVEMDHAELDANVTLTEANLKSGHARVEQARLAAQIFADVARTRLSQAKAQQDSAQKDFERIKSLADKKAVSLSDLDKVSLALRVSQESFAAAQAGVEENKVREKDIALAEVAVEQLEAAMAVAVATREKAFIKAPFSGTVTRILLKQGEAVAMGMPVLEMVETDNFHIEAPFDEANVSQIALGQTARINLDAYPDRDFAAEVTYISPSVTMNMDLSRTLAVKAKALEETNVFLPGMSADVTILVDVKDDVLVVPSECLIRDAYVFIIEGGRAVRRDVETGIGNWENREVLSGLQPGDTIITSVGLKGLAEGTLVRTVDTLD